MKKAVVSVAVLAAAFVFSGCGSKQAAQLPPSNGNAGVAEKNMPAEKGNEVGGVVNSIKDAIGLGSKMKCTSTSKTGEVSVAYVQGKKFKAVSEIENKKQNVIFDGETTYFWADGETKGFKMAAACLETLKASLPEQQKNLISDTVPNIEEEMNSSDEKSSCVPAGEVDFTIPSSVVFDDQCEIMKKTLESVSNIKMPAGVKIPTDLPGMPN